MTPIEHLSIPIQLITHVKKAKITKAFLLFLYLKSTTPGKFRADSNVLSDACIYLDVRCSKTSKKYINSLFDLGWLYYSPRRKYIYIKSFDKIREELRFTKTNAAPFKLSDFNTFNSFITAALITENIRSQIWASRRKKINPNPASMNSDNAQMLVFSNYYGLSNRKIGSLLNCAQTRACVLKNKAEKDGYIITEEKYLPLFVTTPDSNLLRGLRLSHPHLYHRLKTFKCVPKILSFSDEKAVKVMLQLHDSIKSNIRITKRKRISPNAVV